MKATRVARGVLAAGILLLVACAQESAEPPAEIEAVRVTPGADLNDPDAAFWREAPQVRVPMLPQNVASPTHPNPAVTALYVRAAHDGDAVALRLEWEDATESRIMALDQFGDQVAVQFPLEPSAEVQPSPMMGHQGTPVRILQWRSMLQWELAHGPPAIQDLYPNAVVDLYPDRMLAGEIAAPYTGARAVGNPVSQPRLLTPVVSQIAEGFGTLSDARDQQARGGGVWRTGRWHVAISHPFIRGEGADGLKPGIRTVVAFAVWDGGNREVGSRKAWANWIPFRIVE